MRASGLALGLFALGLFALGCGARPLATDSAARTGRGGGAAAVEVGAGGSAAGAGGSAAGVGAGGDGVGLAGRVGTGGGSGGGGGVGAPPETGCAWVTASDCAGAETLTLSNLRLLDGGGDGMFSAGEAATVSLTLEAGDQGYSYPSVGLTDDNPLVTIAPSAPEATVYAFSQHQQIGGTFDFLVDPFVAPGTVVHFTACAGMLGQFCSNGPRLSFEVAVWPQVFPTWTVASGRPPQFPTCGSATGDPAVACAGVDQLYLSNPRAMFSRTSTTLFVNARAWLTNMGSRSQAVCVRAAAGDRPSNVSQQDLASGKSADVAPSWIDLGPSHATGDPIHLVAWTGIVQADCPNVSRIEFDAVVP